MKKLIFIFVVFFNCNNFSQNLVSNFSFETLTGCDSLNIYFGNAPPWDSPTQGTADIDNICALSGNHQVPVNNFGFQHPHTGNGYVGAAFFVTNSPTREYIQVQLDSVLVSQRKYCVNFHVSLSNKSGEASNNIGMYFSTTHTFISTNDRLNFIPQINDTNIISDTLDWTLISGEYIATGGEKYIIIGNFYSNAATDSIPTGGQYPFAYYYIDDVSVWDCAGSGFGVGELTEDGGIEIYPNPTNGEFSINLKREYKSIKIEITDVIGKLVFTITTKETKQINLTLNQPPGLYFVSVIVDGNKKVLKLVSK